MKKPSLGLLPAVAIAVAACAGLYAQAPQGGAVGGNARGAAPAAPPAAAQMIKQVKPGLYMVTGAGGNSTVRVTDQGVILVDTKNLGDAFYNDLMAQIKSVTSQPVKYVFITHVHQDHAGNIGRFEAAGVPVIANEGLRKNLTSGGTDGTGYTSPAGKPAAPDVTYAKSKTVTLGNAKAIAYHFGNAHTSGDTVVYFPDLKVIAMGDEFVAQTPNADYPDGGSVLEWPNVLTQVLKLDFDTAIPGHGNDPMTKKDVVAFQQKMELIAKKGVTLRKQGVAKDQIRQQIQDPALAPWQVTGVVNDARLDLFYAELSKAK